MGDLLLIFGCIMMIFSDVFSLGYAEIFIGMGTFCIWASITKYLANTEDFYVIIRTFNAAIPTILKVWVGILPFYIGVCFLSLTVVWEFTDCFGSWTRGFYTIFSVQAGDALFDTYHAMKEANFWYAQLFMYCFIFFLVSIVQNIFMVIVEDSYISIKYAKNFDWLNAKKDGERGDNDDAAHPGPGHGSGGGFGGNDDHGAPPPPNQPSLYPEHLKKHMLQMGIAPQMLQNSAATEAPKHHMSDPRGKDTEGGGSIIMSV